MFWPSNTSAIISALPPRRFGVGSGVMNTLRNTGMIMSFALSLTAATSVIPASVVYSLFIGNLGARLSSSLASSYLSGQSFAFEISAFLVVIAIVFSIAAGGITRSKKETSAVEDIGGTSGDLAKRSTAQV